MYTVVVSKAIQKQIEKLPDKIEARILDRISELEENPRPSDVKKLNGRDAWRVRVGDYRIIYEIADRRLTVILIQVAHRREVYR